MDSVRTRGFALGVGSKRGCEGLSCGWRVGSKGGFQTAVSEGVPGIGAWNRAGVTEAGREVGSRHFLTAKQTGIFP